MATPIRPSLPLRFPSHSIASSRCSPKSIRHFASAIQTLPSPSPYLPTYPDPSPSSIATSSAWTLDHPLWKIPTSSPERRNVIAALIFASDEDLVSALISSPRRRSTREHDGEQWAASIDPGLAFLALRSRPTYDLFLQNLRPHLRRIYNRLQASDSHQLLVSDLLLRHPDPRILRDLLEIDTTTSNNGLRANLVLSIFSHVTPSVSHLAPLSRSTCIRLAKIIQREKGVSVSATRSVFDQLRHSTDSRDPEQIWPLLSLTLHILPSSPDVASAMLDQLVSDGLVSPSLILPPSSYPDSRAQVYSTILRFALRHKFQARAQQLTNSLLEHLESSGLSLNVWESIMESVRTALASKHIQDASWASKLLLRMCKPNWPIIPSATIERALEGIVDPKDRAEWYAALPTGTYDPPSAPVLLSLTTISPPRSLWKKIIGDLATLSPEETAHVQGDILSNLLLSPSVHLAEPLFVKLGSLQLSLEDVERVVGASVQARKTRFGGMVLREWEERRPNLTPTHRLKLAELFLKLGDKSHARRQLACVDVAQPGVADAVHASLQEMSKGGREIFAQMGLTSP